MRRPVAIDPRLTPADDERVGVVLALLVGVLMLLSELPGWLLLLLVVGGVLAVRSWRGRPLLAVVRVAGRFVRGEQRA